jgi:hypothetical protein
MVGKLFEITENTEEVYKESIADSKEQGGCYSGVWVWRHR